MMDMQKVFRTPPLLRPMEAVKGTYLALGDVARAVLDLFFPLPDRENPTVIEILARRKVEQRRRLAEQSAKEAQERAETNKREAEQASRRARERQAEVDKAAEQAAKGMTEMMGKALKAAQRAQELAKETSKDSEDARKLAQQGEEERKRYRKIYEEAEGAVVVAKKEVDRALKAWNEQRQAAEAARARAEAAARVAAEEVRKAEAARKEVERRLKGSIQPVVMPTSEELTAAQRRIQYKEDRFHFAVAGVAGSGKSSLVNGFRGLRKKDPGAAATGVTETTLEITRYPSVDTKNPFVWYDIPGAGTLKCPDWQYFNDQGLYVFDCIIVLFDIRFTLVDIGILVNARRYNIPTYIVRSKADQHIENLVKEMRDGEDGEDLEENARKTFIEETRKNVQANLKDANLPDQRVYIISQYTLLDIAKGKTPKKAIDEVELFNDLINDAYTRRKAKSDETCSK